MTDLRADPHADLRTAGEHALAAALAPDLEHIDEAACRRFQSVAEYAGQKWTAAILLSLLRGAARFTEIRAEVTGISDRVLAARLKDLEQHGLVEREVVASIPVQVRYSVTEQGSELVVALSPLVGWDQRWNVSTAIN